MSSNNTSSNRGPTLSVHDPEFKNLITVPLSAVHHLPPAHLEISRLVLCKKYDPKDPHNSCTMGDSCKFVHIDMSTPSVQIQSIHVNYAYRNLEEVPHERLEAGEMLSVLAPNNRAPAQEIPSELVMLTKGAKNRHNSKNPLSHCAHYFYNRMCNRGERCGFLHCLYIDPTAAEFQRAPPRAGAGYHNGAQPPVGSKYQPEPAACCDAPYTETPISTPPPQKQVSLVSVHSTTSRSSCDMTNSPRSSSGETHSSLNGSTSTANRSRTVYRRNPYSLYETTVLVQ